MHLLKVSYLDNTYSHKDFSPIIFSMIVNIRQTYSTLILEFKKLFKEFFE